MYHLVKFSKTEEETTESIMGIRRYFSLAPTISTTLTNLINAFIRYSRRYYQIAARDGVRNIGQDHAYALKGALA